jgi:hypothetical protein
MTCKACRHPINPGEPVAWTWARQQIHEACMPIAALADRGARKVGAWAVAAVGAFLGRHDGRVCAGCLALGLSLTLAEARTLVGISAAVPAFAVLPAACAICSRDKDVLCAIPVDTRLDTGMVPPATDARGRPKCSRCSRIITDYAKQVISGSDRFHQSCWDVLLSGELVRTSRALCRESRELIERSRRVLDPPVDPDASQNRQRRPTNGP